MSLRFNSMITNAAVVITAVSLVASCVSVDEVQTLEASGYLAPPEIGIDVTVENLGQTKSDIVIEEPDPSEIYYIVKDKDGKEKYKGNGVWTSPLLMPVGKYTIEASFGDDPFAEPCFAGSASGDIEPFENELPDLVLTLSNSLVRVTLNPELESHFIPEETVSLNSGSKAAVYGEWFYAPSGVELSISLSGLNSVNDKLEFKYSLTPTKRKAYNVVCGKSDSELPIIVLPDFDAQDAWASRVYITEAAQISGNISDENKSLVVYEATCDDWKTILKPVNDGNRLYFKGLTTGQTYKVRARIGALESNVVTVTPSVDGLVAEATHTVSDGLLDGTDVEAVFNKSTSINNAITEWNFEILSGDGSVSYRTFEYGSGEEELLSDGSLIADGWPYLPTGSSQEYILRASAVMDGQTYEFTDQRVSFTNTPQFTVGVSAETSYSRYVNYKNEVTGYTLALANTAETGDKVMNISGSVSISNNILGKSKYSSLTVATMTYDNDCSLLESPVVSVNVFTPNTIKSIESEDVLEGMLVGTTIQNQYCGDHSLKTTFKFDGYSASNTNAEYVCQVSGIPYTSPNFYTTEMQMKSTSGSPTVMDWVYQGTVEWWKNHGYQILKYYLGGVTPGTMYSPSFYLPENTNISYTAPVCFFTTGRYNAEIEFFIGFAKSFNAVTTNSQSISRLRSESSPKLTEFTSVTKSETVSGTGRISLSTDEEKDGNAAENWFTVASLNVSYAKK